jgi:hypothetical protein
VNFERYRRLVATPCLWWCLPGIVLCALQPFLFTHFQRDAWEDEPGFRVRNVEAMALFAPDDRVDHPHDFETTLYAPAAAHLDQPDALQDGFDALMSLVAALLPLIVILINLPAPAARISCERVPFTSGAPPPAAPWRSQPPKTAPPLTA